MCCCIDNFLFIQWQLKIAFRHFHQNVIDSLQRHSCNSEKYRIRESYWVAVRFSKSHYQATKFISSLCAFFPLSHWHSDSTRALCIHTFFTNSFIRSAIRRLSHFLLLLYSLTFYLRALNIIIIFLRSTNDKHNQLSVRCLFFSLSYYYTMYVLSRISEAQMITS